MVELVDTQDLESCEETRAGSIPVIRTKSRISTIEVVLLILALNKSVGFLWGQIGPNTEIR